MKKLLTIFFMALMPFLMFGQGSHAISHVDGVKKPGSIIESNRFGYNFTDPESSYIDFGQVSDSTDASGDVVVTHTLADSVYFVQTTYADSTYRMLGVHSKNDSTFSIRVFDNTGAAQDSVPILIDWIARKNY